MDERVTDPVNPTDPTSPMPHASHDELLVVRYATDDVTPAESAQARTLTGSCPDCSTLVSDIRAISASARTELPQPRRPRDFTITAGQARDLRNPGLLGSIRRALGTSSGMLRPLAGVTLSLGIALMVAGTVLPGPSRYVGESGQAVPEATTSAGRVAPESEPTLAAIRGSASSSSAGAGGAGAAQLATPPVAEGRGSASAAASSGTDTGAAGSAAADLATAGPRTDLPPPMSAPGPSGAAASRLSPAAAGSTPDPGDRASAGGSPAPGPAESSAAGRAGGSAEGPAEGSPEGPAGSPAESTMKDASHAAAAAPPEPTTAAEPTTVAAAEPTTVAAAGEREVTPAPPGAQSPSMASAAPEDRRPMLIVLGLLLVAAAVLIGLRSIARRA